MRRDISNIFNTSVSRVRLTGFGTQPVTPLPASTLLTSQRETIDWRGNITRQSTHLDSDTISEWTITERPTSIQPEIQQTIANLLHLTVSSTLVTNRYTYDAWGRQTTAVDGHGNITTTEYNALGQIISTENAADNRTTYAYDELGRQIAITDPLTNTTYTAYDGLNNIIAQWGATYPVAYEYDTQKRKISMKTYRSENGNGDTTRWLYDCATGLLTNKIYADGSCVIYTYTELGQLASRIWARGVITDYSYDLQGQLTNINYSDSTPGIAYAYNRIGHMTSVTDASGTRTFTTDGEGRTLTDTIQFQNETFTLHEAYDTLGRNVGYALSNSVDGASSLITGTWQGHDALGRISEVSVSGVPTPFRYHWLRGSDLVSSLVMPNGVMRQTVYDPHRDLTIAITYTNSAGVILTHRTFTRDAAARLTGRTQYHLGD